MEILVRSILHNTLKGVELHLLEIIIGKRTGYRSTYVKVGLYPTDLFLSRVENCRISWRASEKEKNASKREFAFEGTTRSATKAYKDFGKMLEVAKDSRIEFKI